MNDGCVILLLCSSFDAEASAEPQTIVAPQGAGAQPQAAAQHQPGLPAAYVGHASPVAIACMVCGPCDALPDPKPQAKAHLHALLALLPRDVAPPHKQLLCATQGCL